MTNLKNYEEANLCIYWRIIGKLIYLLYSTKPDIIFVVGKLNRYNVDPRKRHLQVTKRVIRYLKSIIDLDLIFHQEISK